MQLMESEYLEGKPAGFGTARRASETSCEEKYSYICAAAPKLKYVRPRPAKAETRSVS